MPDTITDKLELISSTAKKSADAAQLRTLIQAARTMVEAAKVKRDGGNELMLTQLDTELLTWLSKLDVILKEPVGRQGMAKHAGYWAEKVKNVG